MEYSVAKAELEAKIGQLRYLKNINTQRLESAAGAATVSCSICMESLSGNSDVCVIGCGHSFHKDCIDYLIRKQPSAKSFRCPICRQVTNPSEFLLVADESATKSASNLNKASSIGEVVNSVRGEGRRVEAGAAAGPAYQGIVKDATDIDSVPIPVVGQWGTKITALLRDLLSLPLDDKAVVFSQWSQVSSMNR